MEQLTEKKVTFFRFEDLRIYHKALDYATWVFNMFNEDKENQDSSIIEKFKNSSQSIALNIAEGSARNKSQFIYYLKMAKSALRECIVITTILKNLEYIDEMQEEESRTHLMEMTKMLGALISSLQRNSNNNNNNNNYNNENQ